MNNLKLHLLTVLLLMYAGWFGQTAQAAVNDEIVSEDFRWKITKESADLQTEMECKIIATTRSGDVTIPQTMTHPTLKNRTYKVTGVGGGGGGNWDKTAITSITIQEGCLSIDGVNAFRDCKLTTLVLPSTLSSIDPGALSMLDNLTTIVVADGNPYFVVGELGELFTKPVNGKRELVRVPTKQSDINSNEKLGREGVYNAVYSIPSDVEIVRNGAFAGVEFVKVIKVHENVTSMTGTYGQWLQRIDVADANPNYKSIDGVLLNKEGTTLMIYPGMHKYDELGGKELTYKVPDGVTVLANGAFRRARYVEEIDLNEVVEMNVNSLYNCANLRTITIPATLTTIPEGAVVDCMLQTKYIVDPDNEYFSQDEFGVLYNKDKTVLQHCPMYNSGDNGTYIIPASVKDISNQAFYACKKITNIVIPDGSNLEDIGQLAFQQSVLETINLEKAQKLKEIHNNAFNSTALTTITLPKSLTLLPTSLFANTKHLESVYIEDGSQLRQIGNTIVNNSTVHTFEFLGSTTLKELGTCVFKGSQITSFEIPASVTIIGERAFAECDKLTDISFAEDSQLKTISRLAFADSSIKVAKLGGEVTVIGVEAFRGCKNLTTIEIPKTTTSIDKTTFLDCIYEA